jgi:MoaA/NifB/PqqE/SkfB family radical SAM enzyme
MTLEQSKKILSYFPKATHLSFSSFGEPLLVDDLFKIMFEFKKRPMRISLITNGTLLSTRIDEIIDSGLHRISISMNSLNSAEYQTICGGNENIFNDALSGIQSLVARRRSSGPHIHVSFVLTRDLFDRAQEIIRFAEEMMVDSLDLHNMIQHNPKGAYGGMLMTDDREVAEKLSEWCKKKYRIRVGWPKLVQKGLKTPAKVCKHLWDWLGVDMEGNTAGCSKAMPTREKYGNLFREGSQSWNNDFRKKLRSSFLRGDMFLLDCCKTCTEVQP